MTTLVVDKAPTLEDAARAAEAIAGHDPHTAERDGTHTNWRFAPYLGQSDSFQQMITPDNTAAHMRAAADLLEHALATTAKSALRPIPIPTDAAATLNRCAEPIDYLRHHATPDYLQTGALPPTIAG